MASLNDQLNLFKAKVRNAPVLGKRTVDQRGSSAPDTEPSASAPATTAPNSGVNSPSGDTSKRPRSTYGHTGTALVHIVDYLRQHEVPILLKDLEQQVSSPIEPLIPLLQQNRNVRVNMRDRTATYVSRYDIYSGDELLKFLAASKTFMGLPVKELRDGWSGAIPTVQRLEADHKLLVVKHKKDGNPRLIWRNVGGPLGQIDREFVDMWQSAKVPSASELPEMLERVGLKPSSVDPSKTKTASKPAAEKKHKRPQRGKITNTHLRGVLKDYGN